MLSVRRCVTESKCDRGGLYSPDRRQTCTGSPDAAIAAIWRWNVAGGTPGSVLQVYTQAVIIKPRRKWKRTMANIIPPLAPRPTAKTTIGM